MSKLAKALDRCATELLIERIRSANPGAVHFQVTPGTVKIITKQRRAGEWLEMIYAFGNAFVLGFLLLAEEAEYYEICAAIKAAIEAHNHQLGACLPTH